jgi:predicted nucleic acid-binding protein
MRGEGAVARRGHRQVTIILDEFQWLTEPGSPGVGLLLPRMWELRENLTPYDAAYVALAENSRRTGELPFSAP